MQPKQWQEFFTKFLHLFITNNQGRPTTRTSPPPFWHLCRSRLDGLFRSLGENRPIANHDCGSIDLQDIRVRTTIFKHLEVLGWNGGGQHVELLPVSGRVHKLRLRTLALPTYEACNHYHLPGRHPALYRETLHLLHSADEQGNVIGGVAFDAVQAGLVPQAAQLPRRNVPENGSLEERKRPTSLKLDFTSRDLQLN